MHKSSRVCSFFHRNFGLLDEAVKGTEGELRSSDFQNRPSLALPTYDSHNQLMASRNHLTVPFDYIQRPPTPDADPACVANMRAHPCTHATPGATPGARLLYDRRRALSWAPSWPRLSTTTQFHPESIVTEHGYHMIANFLSGKIGEGDGVEGAGVLL